MAKGVWSIDDDVALLTCEGGDLDHLVKISMTAQMSSVQGQHVVRRILRTCLLRSFTECAEGRRVIMTFYSTEKVDISIQVYFGAVNISRYITSHRFPLYPRE